MDVHAVCASIDSQSDYFVVTSIIIHEGAGVDSGHYIEYTHCVKGNKSVWIEYNDHRVTRRSWSHVRSRVRRDAVSVTYVRSSKAEEVLGYVIDPIAIRDSAVQSDMDHQIAIAYESDEQPDFGGGNGVSIISLLYLLSRL